MRMEQVPAPRLSPRERLKQAREEWTDSVFIGVLLTFITALALLLDPFLGTINNYSAWRALNTVGMILTGLAFAALVLFAVYRPRLGGYVATFVICVIGGALSVHPLRVLGVGFYGSVLGVATYATWLQERFLSWLEAVRERGDE